MRTRHLVSVAVLTALGSFPAFAQKAQIVKFDIQAKPLSQALNAWAEQTGYQILIPQAPDAARMAPALQGNYAPEGALRVLLGSTDLKYQFVGDRVVTVREAEGKTE